MFCPKCAAQNKDEQKFCRNCGQSLASVRMALTGRLDEVAGTLAKDRETIASGVLTVTIFVVIALIANFFGGFSTAVNLLLGLLIGGTLAFKGLRRLDRSISLLTAKEQAQGKLESSQPPSALSQPNPPAATLPSVPDTDPLLVPAAPVTVTEQTTLHLKRSE